MPCSVSYLFFFFLCPLLSLVGAHEVLCDAKVVDCLCDAEEGRDDDHPAEGALVERSHALVHVDLAEGVGDAGVRLLGGALRVDLSSSYSC